MKTPTEIMNTIAARLAKDLVEFGEPPPPVLFLYNAEGEMALIDLTWKNKEDKQRKIMAARITAKVAEAPACILVSDSYLWVGANEQEARGSERKECVMITLEEIGKPCQCVYITYSRDGNGRIKESSAAEAAILDGTGGYLLHSELLILNQEKVSAPN
jgi:hypothetical protein